MAQPRSVPPVAPQQPTRLQPKLSSSAASEAEIDFAKSVALDLVAKKYPRLDQAVLEAIQNSIDAAAKRITVTINTSAKSITICDNGNGASIVYFNAALKCIGKTQKDKRKLGRFGLGVVAAHGKCEVFTFTSIPKDGSNGMQTWTFNTEKLRQETGKLLIPVTPASGEKQWWNSKLEIRNYYPDKYKGNIDLESFCQAITTNFNSHMMANGVEVDVTVTGPSGPEHRIVKAVAYTGTPLPEKFYTGKLCGRTSFKMFVMEPKTDGRRQKGKVKVIDSRDYGNLLTSRVLSGILEQKDLDLITSGVFEGEIKFDDKVKLEPSRRFFEQDEALGEACEHIEAWIKEIGKTFIDEAEQTAAKERYERLGDEAMKSFGRLLKSNKELNDALKLFKFGSIAKQHTAVPNPKDGETHGKSTDGSPGLGKDRKTNAPKDEKDDEDKPEKPDRPERERPEHRPLITDGDRGQTRTLVEKNSQGLHLHHGGIASGKLWLLDEEIGRLTINIRHNLFVACDNLIDRKESLRNASVRNLQCKCIVHALHLLKLKYTLTDAENNFDSQDPIYSAAVDLSTDILHDTILMDLNSEQANSPKEKKTATKKGE